MPRFLKAMSELLDSTKTVIATVAQRGAGFKRRDDAEFQEVTRHSRDDMPGRVLAWLERRAR